MRMTLVTVFRISPKSFRGIELSNSTIFEKKQYFSKFVMGSRFGYHLEKLNSEFEISGDLNYDTIDGYTDDIDIIYDYVNGEFGISKAHRGLGQSR